MKQPEWEKWVKEEIQKGNPLAFKQLYDRFYPGLCVLASRYTGSYDIAEEIVQNTFLTIWEMRTRLNINSSVHTYLYASVRNSCINHIKHVRVEHNYTTELEKRSRQSLNYFLISTEDGQSLMLNKELEDKIEASIQALPEKCRRIFLLSRKENLKYNEIAQITGLSINTVQRQISIALEKLRENLKEFLSVLLAVWLG